MIFDLSTRTKRPYFKHSENYKIIEIGSPSYGFLRCYTRHWVHIIYTVHTSYCCICRPTYYQEPIREGAADYGDHVS